MVIIVKSLYRSAVDLRIGWIYWLTLVFTLYLGYLAWNMIVDLPKPETMIELGKYYFTDTASYLKATGLSLLTGIFLVLIGFVGLVSSIVNEVEYSNTGRWFVIIIGALTCLGSLYFLSYGVYLLIIFILIGLIGMLFFHSGSGKSNSRRA